MKKILVFLLAASVFTTSFAAGISSIKPVKKASEIFVQLGVSGTSISLQALSQIKIREFEAIAGYKMKAVDKIGFKIAQRELRKSINNDGTLNNNRAAKAMREASGETGFHLGGFALGFFVGLIGVLIAYLIKDDKKRNRVKWAWIGFGTWVVLYIILLASIL